MGSLLRIRVRLICPVCRGEWRMSVYTVSESRVFCPYCCAAGNVTKPREPLMTISNSDTAYDPEKL